MRTLIIGDVHGQLKRLEALLLQEGIIGNCDACAGTGDVSDGTGEAEFCDWCNGDGLARIDRLTRVIQLGDLVDLMPARTSPAADEMIVTFADKWIDEFLWGNHEYPLAGGPVFSGYQPNSTVQHRLNTWISEGRLRMAVSVGPYLVTHAGLSDQAFTNIHTGSLNRYSVEKLGCWINRKHGTLSCEQRMGGHHWPLRDNISWFRGGDSYWGGITWRDSREGLWPVPQIFGHTSHSEPLTISHEGKTQQLTSYCIDTSKNCGLAAIMLGEGEPRLINVKDEDPEPEPVDPITEIPDHILKALIV